MTSLLLIYPNAPERDIYVAQLTAAGHLVRVVDTTEGLEPLGSPLPDLIVAELLPDPDAAWAFLARIVAARPMIPSIVFTSMIRPDGKNREKARRLGCAAFVAKPCAPTTLVEVVGRVVRGERGFEVVSYFG